MYTPLSKFIILTEDGFYLDFSDSKYKDEVEEQNENLKVE